VAGVRCEFRGNGMKRAPVSQGYVTALESRISHLEAFLSKVKSAPKLDKESTVGSISFGEHPACFDVPGICAERNVDLNVTTNKDKHREGIAAFQRLYQKIYWIDSLYSKFGALPRPK
jgi:hypothetical protein